MSLEDTKRRMIEWQRVAAIARLKKEEQLAMSPTPELVADIKNMQDMELHLETIEKLVVPAVIRRNKRRAIAGEVLHSHRMRREQKERRRKRREEREGKSPRIRAAIREEP